MTAVVVTIVAAGAAIRELPLLQVVTRSLLTESIITYEYILTTNETLNQSDCPLFFSLSQKYALAQTVSKFKTLDIQEGTPGNQYYGPDPQPMDRGPANTSIQKSTMPLT